MRTRHGLKIVLLNLFLLAGLGQTLYAGETPILKGRPPLMQSQPDTAKIFSDIPVKSPLGAVLRSAVVPGWGQFYNRKKIKGIVVFGVDTFLFSGIIYYHRRWRSTGRRSFQDQRNNFTLYFSIAYALTLVDAYVDAYLFGFDKAVRFSISSTPENPAVGLRIQWPLK